VAELGLVTLSVIVRIARFSDVFLLVGEKASRRNDMTPFYHPQSYLPPSKLDNFSDATCLFIFTIFRVVINTVMCNIMNIMNMNTAMNSTAQLVDIIKPFLCSTVVNLSLRKGHIPPPPECANFKPGKGYIFGSHQGSLSQPNNVFLVVDEAAS
jgi:hypothetical protein